MGFVRGEDRQQNALFPVSLEEMVPSDHACRVIDAFVRHLPMVDLGFGKSTPKATGRPPYDPADLLKLYLYGYLHQVRSSRRLEHDCRRNVEVMWLLGRLAPDHKTIAQFRKDNGEALKRAGAAFVRFCQGAGLVRGDWVAVDGSKFQAVASRKAVVWKKYLVRRQAAVEQRIAAYLQSLDAADQTESDTPSDAEVRHALAVLQDEQRALQAMQTALGEASHRVMSEPESRSMACHGPSYKAQCTTGARRYVRWHAKQETLKQMDERATPEAMRRRCTVEHPFAGLKHWIFGYLRILMRGLSGAKAELAIATMVWNLKRATKVLGEAELGRRLATA